MKSTIFSLGLFFIFIFALSFQSSAQIRIDTVKYKRGLERSYVSRTLSYQQWLKRKEVDSMKVYLFVGDDLQITASSKRAVSMMIVDSTNKTIFANTITAEPTRFSYKVKNKGFYTFYFSNASILLSSKIDVKINQLHTSSRCTLSCSEFDMQQRIAALPEKITTTVSNKQPKEFTIAAAPLDTITLFIPGSAKIPRLDIVNRENQRLYTLESQRGPLSLNMLVLDSGLVKIKLSKTGILGRIPTKHTLYLGKITPKQISPQCCDAIRLVETRPVPQVSDTLMQVQLDTTISLAAMRNITDKPTYPINISTIQTDSTVIKRFLLVDRTNNDSLITNSLIELKKRLNSFYDERLNPSVLEKASVKMSLTKISFESAKRKVEIPTQLAILDITDLTPLDKPIITHSNKIQSMDFRLIIVDFINRYTLVYPDK
jgi:hypothetical protein